MGRISKPKKQKLKGKETILPYFEGCHDNGDILGGAELEFMLFARADNGFRLASDEENVALIEEMKAYQQTNRFDFSNEPGAHMIEIKTDPYILESIENIPREILTAQASCCARPRRWVFCSRHLRSFPLPVKRTVLRTRYRPAAEWMIIAAVCGLTGSAIS